MTLEGFEDGRSHAGPRRRPDSVTLIRGVLVGRFRWFPPIVLMMSYACHTAAGVLPEPRPTTEALGVTLVLEATPEGRCCVVSTVNPGRTAMAVVCFAEAFDGAGRLLATHVVPPLPPGHRRSSGFAAPPGRHRQGAFELPAALIRNRHITTCRPAAWHGGAPI
jgi:hypothetical protein